MTRGIEFRQRDDGSSFFVVEWTGDVDLATYRSNGTSLRNAFTRAVAAEASVIVDCSNVTFLALSGIRVLIEAKQHCSQTTRLCLVGPPSGPLDRMLNLLGLHSAFEIYSTVADALCSR